MLPASAEVTEGSVALRAIQGAGEFMQAYRQGLAAFASAVERTDPKDEAAFKPILMLALERFGMTATMLSERVGHSKGTISKWVNTDAMPAQSTREIVREWILSQAKKQLDELDSAA